MRMFHWSLALCFVAAQLTSESERLRLPHAFFGYAMVVLLLFRFLYGLWGPRSVRWSSIAGKLRGGWSSLQTLRLGHQGWRMLPRGGYNLAGTLITTMLMLMVPLLLFSGYLLDVNSWDGWEEVHEVMANSIWVLVVSHLGLLLGLSVWFGKNLALPMWRGRIAGSGPDLVAHPRVWLAVVLLALSVAFGAWAVR